VNDILRRNTLPSQTDTTETHTTVTFPRCTELTESTF
jgi:hypothetical protein